MQAFIANIKHSTLGSSKRHLLLFSSVSGDTYWGFGVLGSSADFDIECKLNSHLINYHHAGGLKDSKISSEKKSKNEMKREIFKERSNQRKSISNDSSQNNVAMDKKMPPVDKSSMKVSSMDKLSTKNYTLDYNSHKHSSADKSSMKGSSMNRLSTNSSTLDNNSLKHSSLDNSSMKGSSMNRLSTKNSTQDNNSLKHLSLDNSLMKGSSMNRLSTNNSTTIRLSSGPMV